MNPTSNQSISSSTKQNLLYFCFNPLCKQASNRIFNKMHEHFNKRECSKWIISNDLTNMPETKYGTFNEKKGIYVQFQEKPMEVVMNSSNLKDLFQIQLKGYLQKVKLDMQVSLWTVQNVLMMKIDKYFDPLTSFSHQAKKYISGFEGNVHQSESIQKQSQKINNILQNLNLNDITNLQSKVFLPDCTQAQQKIRSSIQQLTQSIFCTKLSLISDIGLNQIQKNSLTKYLKDPQDDHNKRSFKVTNLFQMQQRNIYQKKVRYINNQTITQLILKCPVCNVNYTTSKKKQLMLIWNSLTQHILNAHIQQAGYSFQHLITGKAACLISIDQIIYRMINYGYQCLQFVYKNNRKGYNFHYSNKNKLSIQIRCKGQTYILPLNYLQISQFHQLCSLITTISYTIQKNMYKPKPIYIYINNPAEICYIRKVCDLMMLKNIFIVNQRRHDQSTIIYQEEFEDNNQKQLLFQDLNISKDSKESKEYKDMLNFGDGQEQYKSSY